jgi:hypothetical protein
MNKRGLCEPLLPLRNISSHNVRVDRLFFAEAELPPLFETRLVVVNELPAARDTLLLRLLAARRVLQRAVRELYDLPDDASERVLALPILVRFRIVDKKAAEPIDEWQEFLMDTEDLYQDWRRKTINEGERNLLLRMVRRRFGNDVTGDIEQRIAAASHEQIDIWADRVLSVPTLADLLAD